MARPLSNHGLAAHHCRLAGRGPTTRTANLTLVCNGVEQWGSGSSNNKSLTDLGIIVDYTRNTISFQNNTFPISSTE